MEAITGVFATRSAAERALQQVHLAGIPDRQNHASDPRNRRPDRQRNSNSSHGHYRTARHGHCHGRAGGRGSRTHRRLSPDGAGPRAQDPSPRSASWAQRVLAAAGATVGATAGGKAEKSSYEGLPEDEIFVYEDALRKGRSVVIALADEHGPPGFWCATC